MATCLAVIKRSMRMLGALASGRDPESEESADALEVLIALYQDLVSAGSLGALNPVLISAAYTAREQDRIANDGINPYVVTLPETITPNTLCPGDTWGDCTVTQRAPRDRAVVVIAGDSPATWIYEAALGAWVNIETLVLTSQAPLSANLSEGLAARLALTLASEYGAQPSPMVALSAGRFMSSITSRSAERREPTQAEYF